MATITATVVFSVQPDTDAHLQDEDAIRAELTSWLEDLRAIVHRVDVTRESPKEQER
jgi:hypothetical protein